MLELLRAVRQRAPADEGSALSALRSLGLHRLDRQVLVEAADLLPRSLGSLDAIHLATALRLGPALEAFSTYDRSLARAATRGGNHRGSTGLALSTNVAPAGRVGRLTFPPSTSLGSKR